MYALVEIKGKQYKVAEGGLIKVDNLGKDVGTQVEFDSVLMLSGDDSPVLGKPHVEGARVLATVGKTFKGNKITVLKFKRRKGYERKQGHRQQYTMLKINGIEYAARA